MRRAPSVTLLACSLLIWSALPGQTGERAPNAKADSKEYVIQKGDLFKTEDFFRGMAGCSLEFWGQIREDGKITLPLYGDILVAGKTIPQFNADIQAALSRYLTKVPANASVVIKDKNGVVHGTPLHRDLLTNR